MPLQYVLPDLEGVAEEIRGLYREQEDGSFMLDVEGSGAVKALKAERENRRQLEKKLKALERVDLDRYAELEAMAEEAAEKGGDAKALKKSLERRHARETAGLKKRLKDLSASFERTFLEAEAVRAIAEAGGNAKVLLPHVKARLAVVERDGELAVAARDASGEPDPMSGRDALAAVVEELRKDADFRFNFKGTIASGSGAPGGSAATVAATRKDLAGTADKAAFIREHGLAAFKNLG